MGYFRRYKLSHYTADECRKILGDIQDAILDCEASDVALVGLLEEWGCVRELLARHEGKNKAPLDKKCPYKYHAPDCDCDGAGGDR